MALNYSNVGDTVFIVLTLKPDTNINIEITVFLFWN